MRSLTAGHVLIPLVAALVLLPQVPAAAGLVAGIALALTVGNPFLARTRKLTSQLLMYAVVALGAGMDLRVVAQAGAHGLIATAVGIAGSVALGLVLSRLIGVAHNPALLITIGTAICGGSAIAAAAPVLRADDREVSVSLGTVFLLNAAALLLFPFIGRRLGLDQHQFGMWAALAIHDTSSVVGAATEFGKEALAIATAVKLARALWIVPVTLALGAWVSRSGQEAGRAGGKKPWFVLGFLLMAALFTAVPALALLGQGIAAVARRALVLTLFLIGANLTRDSLRAVGARPLLFGLALWVVVATLTLLAVRAGVLA